MGRIRKNNGLRENKERGLRKIMIWKKIGRNRKKHDLKENEEREREEKKLKEIRRMLKKLSERKWGEIGKVTRENG